MSIRLVVFDMAGTTVKDSDNVHGALQKAFERENITVSRNEVNDVMGYPKPVAIKELLKLKMNDNTHTNEYYINKIFRNFQEEMIRFYKTDPEVTEKEGVSETFEALHKNGIKIAIDTGFDRSIAQTILDRLNWEKKGLIDASVTSDEVAKGRPYPDMIFRAMQLTRVSFLDEVAKVGDTASDLQQGTAAGCKYVIGVTSGAFTKEALEKESHTHLINQLPEILSIFNIK